MLYEKMTTCNSPLFQHPDIVECSVLGIPDTVYGEIICAVVGPKTEAQRIEANYKPFITIQDLHKWAKERISPHKVVSLFFSSFHILVLLYSFLMFEMFSPDNDHQLMK